MVERILQETGRAVECSIEFIFEFTFLCTLFGVIAFLIGESLPRRFFSYLSFPFRSRQWERNGQFYQLFKIQLWKDHIPDMSKHVKKTIPKKLGLLRDPEMIERLVLETCVAEFVHLALILLSPLFLLLMHGTAGVVGMVVYVLGNLPFVMVQRYNRPRLIKLLKRCEAQKRDLSYA